MKKTMILICATILLIAAFAFRSNFKCGIYGTIDPADGAKRVWAISGRDSFQAILVSGKFTIDTKPGTWRVSVEAVDAGKNLSIDNVLVVESQFTDVGVIKIP
jgi:hypothetical protein